MQNTTTNDEPRDLITIDELKKNASDDLPDYGDKVADYDGYVCDAISEIADSNVSIYTADQIAYCREHGASARDAINEGLAMQPRDYFDANRGHDYEDYEAHIGACAEFMDIERAIYDGLENVIEYAVICHMGDAFGPTLDAAAWAAVEDCHAEDWDDNNAVLSDIYDEAEASYRRAIEGDEDEVA